MGAALLKEELHAAPTGARPACRCARSLRVLSFNTPTAGAEAVRDAWVFRSAATASLIARHAPDIVCLQEPHEPHAREVAEALGMHVFGRGRLPGGWDEYQPIMWRAGRLRLVRSGTFWLAPPPAEPGCLAWDAACTRHCNWAELAGPAGSVFVFNTHWDHVGSVARAQSGALMAERVREIAGDAAPLVVAGDMNCGEDSEGVRAMLLGVPGLRRLGDAREATWVGWEGDRAAVIDHVFVRGFDEGACECWADPSRMESGRRVSDHLPLVAALHFVGGCCGVVADEASVSAVDIADASAAAGEYADGCEVEEAEDEFEDEEEQLALAVSLSLAPATSVAPL